MERRGAADIEAVNVLLLRLKDAEFALARDRLENLARMRALVPGAREGATWRAAYDLNVALNASTASRSAAATRPGSTSSSAGTCSASPPELDAESSMRRGRDPRLHERLRSPDARTRTGHRRTRSSTRSPPRWASWATTCGAPRGHRERRPASRAARAPGRRVRRPRPHALGERRRRQRGERPPAEPGGDRRRPRPLRRRRAERRRRQLRPAHRGGEPRDRPRDHDRRQGDPRARRPPARARARPSGRRSARPSRRMEGSVAIAASRRRAPGTLLLALRGSGQALYVGLADGAFLVASEPYGIVEEAREYLRLDGETPADPARPDSRGQIVVLDADRAGDVGGHPALRLRRHRASPRRRRHPKRLEITTRDVDRGDLRALPAEGDRPSRPTPSARPSAAGSSRGRRPRTCASARTACPRRVRRAARRRRDPPHPRHRAGHGRRGRPGGGRADRATRSRARARSPSTPCPRPRSAGSTSRDDMSDDLFVAISQSGTTTDTNRTVDLLRARGAAVLGDREPPPQRPHRTRRRRPLHVATDATWRCPSPRRRPSTARSPPARCSPRPWPTPAASPSAERRAARARGPRGPARAMREVLAREEADRRGGPRAPRRTGGTGRSSATAATASPRTRSASS